MADTQPDSGDQIFYNVLPPEKAVGPLTNAAGASTTTKAPSREAIAAAMEGPNVKSSAGASMGNNLSGLLTKRNLIIAGAGAVVFLVAGFMIYRWATQPIASPVVTPVVEEPIPEEEPEQQPEGVTTPKEWQQSYFGAEVCQTVTVCGDTSDPDRDGLTNIDEYTTATDPNNSDSNGGGIADGDKVHIFGGDPLKSKTKDGEYTDADYIKYGYDLETDQPYTVEKLIEIKAAIKERGLHQPTITTLGEEALKLYDFVNPDPSATNPLQGVDVSPTAKLNRDTQRSDTIKKVGGALLRYYADKKIYPTTTDFLTLADQVKPYITVATNFTDPINKDKYVYGYIPTTDTQNFTLTYYSETQDLLIKHSVQDAQLEASRQSSNAYDDQRKRDLDSMRVALLLYSGHHMDVNSTQAYVFPPVDRYKTELVPTYLTEIPKDPRTAQDYVYQVGEKFDTFTLRSILDNPPTGTTGYTCNQEECHNY